MKKIKSEIEWIAAAKIEYCFCADSNFGIFERDEEIVDFILASKKKCGYPDVFRPCYAKNSDDRVFRICSKLDSNGMDKGATLAYQTLSRDALVNINRQNMSVEHYSKLLERYNKAGIATYSELILGLPGETYDTFAKGICTLIEAGQHNSVSVYHCEMLPNAEMAHPEYIKKHGIKTIRVFFNHMHSSPDENDCVKEYSNLIVETDTMSRKMWVKANLFSVCVQCFHHLGLLRCFAIYMFYEKNYSYYKFYNSLLEYIFSSDGTVFNKLFTQFEDKLSHSLAGDWNYTDRLFGDVVWLFEEGAFLELLYRYDTFWSEIMPFLSTLGIDENLFNDLLSYQKAVTRRPFESKIELNLNYDFYNYFQNIYSSNYKELEKIKNETIFNSENYYDDWKKYAKECVWYGRRLGKTQYTSERGSIKVVRKEEEEK
jgi:putative methyltransferase